MSYNKPEKDHGEAPVRFLPFSPLPRDLSLSQHCDLPQNLKLANARTPFEQKSHKIRITLSSRKVPVLEKVCSEIVERAKTKDLRAKGPVRLPTKTLKITTRKTPCGEGSKTWDCFEMRIHKRLIEYVQLIAGEISHIRTEKEELTILR